MGVTAVPVACGAVQAGVRFVAARACGLVLAALCAAVPSGVHAQDLPPVSAEALAAAIDDLGRLDYGVRSKAAQNVRRTPAAQAVPALIQAVTEHADGYVRFRALVLLAGFNDLRAEDLMRALVDDPNDRVREVAYAWFETHPQADMAPVLLARLDKELAEFVRPALVRALASLGRTETRVRPTLVREVGRGQDFFRSAVIEALGDYGATYAAEALIDVASLDGPLRPDAVLALGRLGDRRALAVFSELQRTAPREVQPTIASAICLLGVNCASHRRYLRETFDFALRNLGYQPLLRAAVAGLAELAASGDDEAWTTLVDRGIPSRDPERAPVALGLGKVALRNTPFVLGALETVADLDGTVELLREAFDMLEEDFEEERFFVTVRRAYWRSPQGSAARRIAETLVARLEF
jgi:HEAT repeat protein